MKNLFCDGYGLTGFGFVASATIGLFAMLCGLMTLDCAFNDYACGNYSEITGRETKYIYYDACYVKKENNQWIRYDRNYKE